MALDLKIKSNVRNVQARYVKFAHKIPPIITKGVKQAGEQLKTIIDIFLSYLDKVFRHIFLKN